MRGTDLLILYFLSSEKARERCWEAIKRASLYVDKNILQKPLVIKEPEQKPIKRKEERSDGEI